MVALKVQSLNDIVEAYLKSLGFAGDKVAELSLFIVQKYAAELNQEDVIASLDEILYKKIKPYMPSAKNDKFQSIALFKAWFLMNDGAQYCSTALFDEKDLPENLSKMLKSSLLQFAPAIKSAKMEPQKIEPIEFGKLLASFVGLGKKE